MKEIKVSLKDNSYSILVGCGVLGHLPERLSSLAIGTDALVITNALVRKLHGQKMARLLERAGFTVTFFEVEDSEKSKSAGVAVELIGRIANIAAGMRPFIVAFGGGVIGDLAGFVAAVYKRGIPYIQVPTTLLAQVDSSIGGKVAVDLSEGKNLIGAFYQPKFVLVDTSFLSTLPVRQVQNGLAEIVKYGLIRDKKLFSFIESNYASLLANDPESLTHVILGSAAIKAKIITQDEKETKGLRMLLNFGHTIGHAIETAGGYERFGHGEAVALGMRAACALSCRLKLLTRLDVIRVDTLLDALGLPASLDGISVEQVLSFMKFDKKFLGKSNRFVLLDRIGHACIREKIALSHIRAVVSGLL